MSNVDYFFRFIFDHEEKEILLTEAAKRYPKVQEAYLRDGYSFYQVNEKSFIEDAPIEHLNLFVKKGHRVNAENIKLFRQRVSPEIQKIYDGKTKLTQEEKEALTFSDDFLTAEEIEVIKEIAESKIEEKYEVEDEDKVALRREKIKAIKAALFEDDPIMS